MSEDPEHVEEEMSEAARSRQQVNDILDAVEAGNPVALEKALAGLHPADIADLLEQISEDRRSAFLEVWSGAEMGEVLSELDDNLREDVIASLEPEELTQAIRDLDTDDVVDLVEDLEPEQQETILGGLDAGDRVAIEQSLSFPEGSAGRLMQREVVTAPEHWTVGETIDFLRASDNLPEQFYHISLVDAGMRPVADITLGRLLSSRRDVLLKDITEDSFRSFKADETEEDVAYAFNQYHLISAPVVDEAGRIIGAITIDDAMAVLDDEHEEDILRLAGVGEGSLSDNVLETVRARLPWLCVNLVTAIVASLVISQFEGAISQIVALAVLMPIVASMGGNAGTQALTVAVRAIATKDLTNANLVRIVRREALVGLANGLFFAVVMGAVGLMWFGSVALGLVIASAMVINLFVAGLAGIAVPVVLERLKLDPALASGTFVTTVTDVVGFFAFLGLATMVLL